MRNITPSLIMSRLNTGRQHHLEPKRIEYAKKAITDLGYDILEEDSSSIKFLYNGNIIHVFPYSGWFSGK